MGWKRWLIGEPYDMYDDETSPPPPPPPADLPKIVWPAYWALVKVSHEDRSNAAMHCNTVRYSPLTFRLAEALSEYLPNDPHVQSVLADKGSYAEDPGR